ncbi:pyruvate kinase-like isoform X2 [Vespula pensylvanica]|uniref:pyruvate kinase-like isoform X2 n=1 Tax=Vespula pensylvanica TaxID=30213 RepID=UPI001CBA5BCF|nr:pyruvate kinase-like isoform X2 [Vespula pensylvanica]
MSNMISSNLPIPWMINNETLNDNQLEAAYEKNRLDHYMQLDIDSTPRSAKLTNIMVTMSITNSYPLAIANIINAGANILRLNLSHETEKWHVITVKSIREAGNIICKCTSIFRSISVAIDLHGPEIRTGIFRGDSLSMDRAVFIEGNTVRLLTEDKIQRAGTSSCFWVSYQELSKVCHRGDTISIDRGAVMLKVICVGTSDVLCRIIKGGIIGNTKTIQLLDSIISFPIISKQDSKDIELACKLECDFIIVNQARNRKMIRSVRAEINQIGCNWIKILAKICSKQGLQNFDEILSEADGIIFERSSLELDIGIEKLFIAQKSVIAKCNKAGKPVVINFCPIVEKMPKINVELVATAVLDGADTISLTTGNLNLKDTLQLVQEINIVCREAESARWQREIFNTFTNLATIPLDVVHSIAIGAIQASLNSNAAAIIITTTTGRSAVLLSIYRPRCPIVAVTRFGFVARYLNIYFAIHSIHYVASPLPDWIKDINIRVRAGLEYLIKKNYINIGDAIVVVGPSRQDGGLINTIQMIYVSFNLVKSFTTDRITSLSKNHEISF